MNEDSHLKFDLHLGDSGGSDLADTTPFRILVIGPFGRAAPAARPLEVESGDIEAAMTRLRPGLDLDLAGSIHTLAFASMDDFHPDQLVRQVEAFQPLMSLRDRLQDPASFDEAAREIRAWPRRQERAEALEPRPASTPDARRAPGSSDAAGDIERLLGRKPLTAQGRAKSIAEDLVREIVGPSQIDEPPGDLDDLSRAVDAEIADLLRSILHDPAFQELEARWRGLQFLLDRVETGVSLKVYLLNLPEKAWREEMMDAEHIVDSAFYRQVVSATVETHGADPWALVLLDYPIGLGPDTLISFQRCLALARAAKVSVVAAADGALPGAAEDPLWNRLRDQPEAIMGGLLCGRFMLRRPYGQASDPIDTLPFEEIPATGVPQACQYVWGNPAWILAALLGQAYEAAGWRLREALSDTLDGLPTHCYQMDGRVEQQQTTFPVLAESDVTEILRLGLMPVISMRGRDLVRIAREQSLARTPTPLQGRW